MIKTDNSCNLSFLYQYNQVLNDMTVPGNISWYSLLSLFMRHLFFQIWDTEKVQPTWLYGHNSSAIQGPLFSQLWWLRTENKAQLSGRVRPSRRPQGIVSPRMTVATMGARGLGLRTLAHWHFIIKDTCLWNSISKRSLQDTSSDICVFWLSKITFWQVDKADFLKLQNFFI